MLFISQNPLILRRVLLGVFMLLVGLAFSRISLQNSSCDNQPYYHVTAYFKNINGIHRGSELRLAGTKVGEVCSVILEKDLSVKLIMGITKNIDIPFDSAFMIVSNSIGQGKYMKISPGGSFDILQDGDVADYTQSSLSLNELLHGMIIQAERNLIK